MGGASTTVTASTTSFLLTSVKQARVRIKTRMQVQDQDFGMKLHSELDIQQGLKAQICPPVENLITDTLKAN